MHATPDCRAGRNLPSPTRTIFRSRPRLRLLPLAVAAGAWMASCQLLNHAVDDGLILYSLYKKHHWLVRGLVASGEE
jgi:hypothetical protein